MFCPKCGTKQDNVGRFCPQCGADLSEYINLNEGASKTKTDNKSDRGTIHKPPKGELNGVQTVGIMAQAAALSGYGLLACMLHNRMEQGDIFSISQIGKPMHLMYVITMVLGIALLIYGVIAISKRNQSIKKYGLISPVATMLFALFNSRANKVYTATGGGSFSGFLGYGMNVGSNGYDPVDEFYYSQTAVAQYAFVAIVGFVIIGFTIITMMNNDKAVKASATMEEPGYIPNNDKESSVIGDDEQELYDMTDNVVR